jgi:hypothetical protein
MACCTEIAAAGTRRTGADDDRHRGRQHPATVVAATALLGAAAAVRSGSQAGRITAWVVTGLIVLCGAGGATRAGMPDFGNNVTLTAWESDGSTRVLRMSVTLPDAYSPAYRIASGVFATAAILALLVAIVLLTRPSAGRWFRPEAGPPVPPPVLYRPSGPFAPPPVPPHHPAGPPASPSAAEPGPPMPPPAPGLSHPYAVPRRRPPSDGGPSWSRPVEGPGSTRQSRAARKAQLAVLTRRHQRGELTDTEYAALRARLTAD